MTTKKAPSKFLLHVNYETSLLTLITFAISMVSLTWQIVNYFQGAQVRLIAPDQVTIGSSERVNFPNRDGGPYVHFVLQMSYVNAASAGYNATIRAERVRITVEGQRPFEHQWYHFVASDAAGADGTDLAIKKTDSAHPFPVLAGSSTSHETLFQPWQKACALDDLKCDILENYVDWQTFIEWFRSRRRVDFEIITDIFGRPEPVIAKCTVLMSEPQLANLVNRKWASPACAGS